MSETMLKTMRKDIVNRILALTDEQLEMLLLLAKQSGLLN